MGAMEDGQLPIMNAINAPIELCQTIEARFRDFLNGFVIADDLEAQPSQSLTHSQGSGESGAPLKPSPPA